jgi:hypothetical protein
MRAADLALESHVLMAKDEQLDLLVDLFLGRAGSTPTTRRSNR